MTKRRYVTGAALTTKLLLGGEKLSLKQQNVVRKATHRFVEKTKRFQKGPLTKARSAHNVMHALVRVATKLSNARVLKRVETQKHNRASACGQRPETTEGKPLHGARTQGSGRVTRTAGGQGGGQKVGTSPDGGVRVTFCRLSPALLLGKDRQRHPNRDREGRGLVKDKAEPEGRKEEGKEGTRRKRRNRETARRKRRD